jgi:hypothetical protein
MTPPSIFHLSAHASFIFRRTRPSSFGARVLHLSAHALQRLHTLRLSSAFEIPSRWPFPGVCEVMSVSC